MGLQKYRADQAGKPQSNGAAMKIYTLTTPTAKAQARKLFDDGCGEINSEDVLQELYCLLQEANEDAVFNRINFRKMVKYDVKRIGEILDMDLTPFPIEE